MDKMIDLSSSMDQLLTPPLLVSSSPLDFHFKNRLCPLLTYVIILNIETLHIKKKFNHENQHLIFIQSLPNNTNSGSGCYPFVL